MSTDKPTKPRAHCVYGIGFNPSVGGFETIIIDGIGYDHNFVAEAVLRAARDMESR